VTLNHDLPITANMANAGLPTAEVNSSERVTFLLFGLDCFGELFQQFYNIADFLTSESRAGMKSQPLFLGELMISGHLLKNALDILQHGVRFVRQHALKDSG